MSRLTRFVIVGAVAALGLVAPATPANAAAQPLVITTTHLADAQVGVAYTAALKATGGNYGRVWSLSAGVLPAGLQLSSLGKITGTPTQDGASSFTVSVHDTAKPQQSATAVVDLTVTPMRVTTTSLPDSVEGTPYSFQLAASGGTKPYTWSLVAGSFPAGTFTLSSSGKITGTQSFFTGPSTFTVQVKDKAGRTAQRELTMSVQFMHFTTPSTLPAAHKGQFYSVAIKHVGGCASPKWSVQRASTEPGTGPGQLDGPQLPPGLRLGAGVISGFPTAVGIYDFKIVAQCDPDNIFAPYAFADFTLTVS